MRVKELRWQQVAGLVIDNIEVQAVITDERENIIASVTLAVCDDHDAAVELYWRLRRALEGESEVIDDAEDA